VTVNLLYTQCPDPELTDLPPVQAGEGAQESVRQGVTECGQSDNPGTSHWAGRSCVTSGASPRKIPIKRSSLNCLRAEHAAPKASDAVQSARSARWSGT